ncbi:ATP-binding protein [uncultured Thermanaerothrix sp.]|uniref:ATP-binding protein n=1 Tax=uncultured Thermanaerothrix sp. TaxID=1195149 RepID=UPI0026291760|nr:ATP-binding protein [uncultured Thermanaerothrix sp.]
MTTAPLSVSDQESRPIGYVVGGSLQGTLRVRLTVSPQTIQEGSFVTIRSGDWQFYGTVVDLQLGATDPRFADEPAEARLPSGLVDLLHGQTLYTNLEVLPKLMAEIGPEPGTPEYDAWAREHPAGGRILSVRTVPLHHATVRLASAGDVAEIFGEPSERNFVLGYTREQGHPIPIDLEKFVQRSAGIFGATGTGKSFLTRMILAGLIHYNQAAVLVFDMHNEYGFDDIASDTREPVIGLRTKFPGRVRVVGLGSDARIHGRSPDFNLVLAERDLEPEDIEMLTRELNLKETTPTTLAALVQSFGERWFHEFRQMEVGAEVTNEDGKKVPAPNSVAYWANAVGTNVMAAEGLHNKLRRLFEKPYIVADPPPGATIQQIIQLLEAGQHVVLSFGHYESDLDYLLVTNVLTRHIREAWVKKTEAFRSDKSQNPPPRPLVIVLEEAHKLLNRELAGQTTFSTIAREMRKYFVTLLVVDQRPSQIYDEVMSQLGTRISGWLGDESDIHAVLSGLADRDQLRGMLTHLQPREEVLVMGWGVPMAIPIRSRRYDAQFWEELLGASHQMPASLEEATKKLGF